MIRNQRNWNEFVEALSDLAKSYGYVLDEPVFSCSCGCSEISAEIRSIDGRICTSVTVNDIEDLAGELENTLECSAGKANG
jgi:hypothetical protein